mmetsp:Transcript_5469/g.7105  ORF Transcript_5469/g.7105 Transcript_5469/m.7105 type:complete len:213 (+) Transcript_5469:153-791(+)
MLQITRFFSKAAHGSRFENPTSFEGTMKKKTADVIVGAVLGMLQGKSVTANWTEHHFILTPGKGTTPSILEYLAADEPIGDRKLLIDFSSYIEELGRSKNGLFKFSIHGKTEKGESISWDLKVVDEIEYNQWLACLKKSCKPIWEPNTDECRLCNEPFTLINAQHHCRSCGKCVCENCSPKGKTLPNEGMLPVRVCNICLKHSPNGEGVLGN